MTTISKLRAGTIGMMKVNGMTIGDCEKLLALYEAVKNYGEQPGHTVPWPFVSVAIDALEAEG